MPITDIIKTLWRRELPRQLKTALYGARSSAENITRRSENIPVWRYALTDGRLLRRFRDRHNGERCFIIGNGPSIRQQDLTVLRDEVTFVVNWFARYKQCKNVNPTYYCATDLDFVSSESFRSEWHGLVNRQAPSSIIFLPTDVKSLVRALRLFKDREIYYLNYRPWRSVMDTGVMSVDVMRHLNVSMSTVIVQTCLPLVHFMGFSEVYLIGCDCTAGQIDSQEDHFYVDEADDYPLWSEFARNYSERWREFNQTQLNDAMFYEFKIAKQTFKTSGRKVYNAGLGGRLEIFERVLLEDILKLKS